jgi:hypothetical protein
VAARSARAEDASPTEGEQEAGDLEDRAEDEHRHQLEAVVVAHLDEHSKAPRLKPCRNLTASGRTRKYPNATPTAKRAGTIIRDGRIARRAAGGDRGGDERPRLSQENG